MKKLSFFSAVLLLLCLSTKSQSLAVNTDGSAANPNAILDVKSNNKGILIPRVSTAARLAIPNTTGMLVYDLNTNSFWYNTGTEWKTLSSSALATTGPWLVTGNSGTDSTNFLGTLDDVPLNIRVNNIPSGRIDHMNHNSFWGYGSGAVNTAQFNTGAGHEALTSNTTGHSNTAYGRFSMRMNITGHSNTAVGMDALTANTDGNRNTAVGMLSLLSNTIGNENTATGFDALRSNIHGGGNTATGALALQKNTIGLDNTAIGARALLQNTSGSGNTAIGASSMTTGSGFRNTAVGHLAMWLGNQGSSNTAVGSVAMAYSDAGNSNTAIGSGSLGGVTGSFNTGIGASTGVYGLDIDNATAIGYGATVDASNKVRIGNSAVTVIEGQVPFTTPSDGRFKFNVNEDVKGLPFIMQLRPVTYQFDVKRFDGKSGDNASMQAAYTEAENIRRTGFIAQEVEKAAISTGYNFSGVIKPKKENDHYSLSYDAFVVPLVKAVQEQQKLIETQQNKIQQQDEKILALEKRVSEIKKLLQEIKK